MRRARTRALAVTAAVALGAGLAAAPLAGAATAPPATPGSADPAAPAHQDLRGAVAAYNDAGRVKSRLPEGVPSSGRYAFLLQLSAKPTLAVYGAASSPSIGKTRAKSQLASIERAQSAVERALPGKTDVLYRTHAVVSGVAVRTDVANYDALTALPGVTAVLPIAPKTRSNAYAVPFQSAPQAWEAYGDRGVNSTVAVIDTGVDYTHANFGGAGTVADFDAATAQKGKPVTAGEFPGNKVIGGYDLAGDDYNADPTDPATYNPVPDPDPYPLDCSAAVGDGEGHGSHVAGTVAGYGVNADGSTYTGAYDTDTPFDNMRIGPGMAPEAKLYAFRVFGCNGSTDLASDAVDMAADPDGDGDPSDHVDVINMSLGSSYGTNQDADTLVIEQAVQLGISVVTSMGNSGDVYEIGGSPGNSPSTIAVAASADAAAVTDALDITAPAAAQFPALRSVAYDYTNGDDLAGDVVKVSQAGNLDGCDPLDDAAAAAVDGKIAFVEWDANDATRRCGSIARAGNLAAAGASGFIFGSNEELLSVGITGSAVIPGVLVAKSGADSIRVQLAGGQTVTVSGTEKNAVTQLDDGANDTLASFSSRGIGAANNVKPDVAAVGESVFSTASGSGNEGETLSGTSMAAPMVAGLAALVRSQHGGWDPEQVKADIMNTATNDVTTEPFGQGTAYAPGRVGAGRIDAKQALDNEVLAYNADDPGTVSVSFGPVEVTQDTVLTKTVKVQNTGTRTLSYDVSYAARSAVPGATWSVSPSTVTVGPRATKTVQVKLTLDQSALTKTIDPTVDREQAGAPRVYKAETSGVVVLESSGEPELRVPVYAAPRPAATMTQPASLTLPGGAQQTAYLPLSGTGVDHGSGVNAVKSIVAGFELAGTSPKLPACSASMTSGCVPFDELRSTDLRTVGVTSDTAQVSTLGGDPAEDGMTSFAIETDGPWRTLYPGVVSLYVDLDVNGDGAVDHYIYNDRLTVGTDDTDVQVAVTIDVASGEAVDIEPLNTTLADVDTPLLDSNVVVYSVFNGALGLDPANSRLKWGVASESPYYAGPVDAVGYAANGSPALSFDPLKPGLAAYGTISQTSSTLLFSDQPGQTLTVRRDAAQYAADRGQGLMLVHFHNKTGAKVQTVTLAQPASTTTLTVSPASIALGASTTATVTVSGGSGVPTGQVQVADGPTTLGTATLDASGKATLTLTPTSVGSRLLTATYAGDATYGGSNASAPLTVTTPGKATPAVGLDLAKTRVKQGQKVKGTVTVTGTAGVPSGTVQLGYVVKGRFKVLDTAALANGSAKLSWKAKKGTYTLVARYSGDTAYDAADSAGVKVRVEKKRKKK